MAEAGNMNMGWGVVEVEGRSLNVVGGTTWLLVNVVGKVFKGAEGKLSKGFV